MTNHRTENETADGPTDEQTAAALHEFHGAAHRLLGLQMARWIKTNPARFETVKATLQAGGFMRVQTGYDQQGEVVDTGLWLSGPFGGTAEIWNFADDFSSTSEPATRKEPQP